MEDVEAGARVKTGEGGFSKERRRAENVARRRAVRMEGYLLET